MDARHYRFGLELGAVFAVETARRCEGRATELARWGSGAGAPVFESFLATHRALFPAFVRELEGLAAGASLPFATVFALNLREELGYFAPPPVPTAREAAFADHCTDYALPPWLAHNEDSAASDRGTVFLAEVAIDGGEFVAFTYAGELPSGAFGWNGAVAFTLNYVQPARGALGGVGRAFASRALLAARSLEEGLRVAARLDLAAGHNYQIADLLSGRAFNVEAAPNRSLTRELGVDVPVPAFHANQYSTLAVEEVVGNSTLHRTARAAQCAEPHSRDELLDFLGDVQDVDGSGRWPVFHGGQTEDLSGGATLATVLFDLSDATATIFAGNPRERRIVAKQTLRRPLFAM